MPELFATLSVIFVLSIILAVLLPRLFKDD